MSNTDFSIHCAKCFSITHMNSPQGGSVVSCGDFLCGSCAQHLISSSSCPACGKQGVRTVFLNDSLPEDVKSKIVDPLHLTGQLETLISFQIGYYKQILGKAISRTHALEQELIKKNGKIKEMEEKLRVPAASQPFFMNKSADKEPIAQPFLQPNSRDREIPFQQQQQPQQRYTSPQHSPQPPQNMRMPPPPPQAAPHQSDYFRSPRVNASESNFGYAPPAQEATMPEYVSSNPWNQMNVREVHEQGFQTRGASLYDGMSEGKQRRPFTPSRSNFSSSTDNRFSRSPKLRSPGEPLIAPSRHNPLMNQVRPRGGNADIYRPPQQEPSRSAFSSPLNAFMMRNKR